MATTTRRRWAADPNAYGPRRYRRPCDYEAYTPDLLNEHDLVFAGDLVADLSEVEAALATFDHQARARHDFEQLARFLLRAEAVASSKIEGLQVSSARLARHEARRSHKQAGPESDATAEAVLGNVEAMRLAVMSLSERDDITVEDILKLHDELMRHSDHPDLGGQTRTEQNWIGGNDFNPCGADFVPPPPEDVEPLLNDLALFINTDLLPAVVQAGIVHAQFETIHPFADGNGRTGRALIHVVLRRRGLATSFVPPISLALATESSRYVSGLTAYRYLGEPGSAEATAGIRTWLEVFLTATQRATADASALADRTEQLERLWRSRVSARADSAAMRLLPELIGNPVVSVADVQSLTGVSAPAAQRAIATLVDGEVLHPIGNKLRGRLYEATEVFEALTDYERSMATSSGDTRSEQPSRPVPYRR